MNQLNDVVSNIKVKKITIYTSPDGEEFEDFEEFKDYMLNEYELSCQVYMMNDLEDILEYTPEKDILNGEDIDPNDQDAIDKFYEEVDDNWSIYNYELEEKTGVETHFVKNTYRDPLYKLTGTLNGLLEFCKGHCDHYTLDDAGEGLWEEINALEDIKKHIEDLNK